MRVFMRRSNATVLAFVFAVGLASCGGGDDSDSDGMAAPLAESTLKLSNPGVCDPLKKKGTTDGLLGLCVSYCQALNCPEASAGMKALQSQCKAAASTILNNYNALKKSSDPAMPCVKPPGCPCWTSHELAKVGVSFSPHVVDQFPNLFPEFYFTLALVENRSITSEFPYGAYTVAQVNMYTDGTNTCQYFYADFAPGAPTPIVRFQEISTEQATMCRSEIESQIGSLTSQGIRVVCTGNLCPPF